MAPPPKADPAEAARVVHQAGFFHPIISDTLTDLLGCGEFGIDEVCYASKATASIWRA